MTQELTPERLAAEMTLIFYEENAEAYSRNTAGMADTVWLEKFSARIPAKGEVLDVGCAGGRDLEWFYRQGFSVFGIDVSPRMVEIAQARVPDAVVSLGDVTDMKFKDGSFDGVWCSCVLLHLTKRSLVPAISEISRIMKPGAFAYFLVKEGDREGIEVDNRYGMSEKFVSYFTVDEMNHALSEAGFSVVDSEDMHRQVDSYRATDRLFYLACKVE